jgi:hypothetical protein
MDHLIDIIIGLLFLYYTYKGIKKGFLHSILGPIALIIATIGAFIYFQKTENLYLALIISIIGPFLLHFILKLILKIWNKTVNDKMPPSPLSQILGVSFNLFWHGTIIAFTLILIAMVPSKFQWIENTQNSIKSSHSFKTINFLLKDFPGLSAINMADTLESLQDPEKIEHIQKTEEYQNLMQNPKFKDVINDKEMMSQIENRDIKSILQNPKMNALFSDKELIKQLLEFNKVLAESPKKE